MSQLIIINLDYPVDIIRLNLSGMVGAPKVGPARPKIVSAQPSPLAQPNPPGWAGLDFRKPSLDEAK